MASGSSPDPPGSLLIPVPAARIEKALVLQLLAGGALVAVSAIGLLAPASIFVYPHSIPASEPMTVLYSFQGGWLFLAITLGLLCGCFLFALRAVASVRSRKAGAIAVGITVALIALYVAIYPSSSQDLFHNIASARTLWLYGENPLVTPPAAHPDDPLVQQVRAWRDVSSFYGPLFYGLSVIPSKLAGDDVLRNLLAFKILNGLALLALAMLAGKAAELLAPSRRAQAIVMVGWNPLLLYENVANGHNDVLVMLVAVAGLLLAARRTEIGGLFLTGISAAVKYPSAPLAPVVWLWSWKRASLPRRWGLAALALGIAVFGVAIVLAFGAEVELGREAAIGRPPVRSAVALLSAGLQPALGEAALSVSRLICWLAFLASLLASAKRLDGSPRSFFNASFWVMAAITLLTVRQVYPSYLIWFVCLGAVLVGTTAWHVTLLTSVSGLLSNLVFTEWSTWSTADDLLFMAIFVGLPAAFLFLRGSLPTPLRDRTRASRSEAAELGASSRDRTQG
jgi:hypothetical protein